MILFIIEPILRTKPDLGKKKRKTVPAAWSCSFTISYDAEKLKTIKLSGSSPVNY